MQLPFQIINNSKNILGMAHIPHKSLQRPVVILMCYGFNGHRVDNNRISVEFGKKAESEGVYFFRFDYAGLGLSDGEFVDMTPQTKSRDAKAILDFIKGCFQGEEFNLYLIGFSDGLSIIAELIDLGVKPDGLILWSPIFYINKNLVEKSKKKFFIRDPKTKKIAFPFNGLFVNPQTVRSQIINWDLYNKLNDSKIDTICIFGTDDSATLNVAKEVFSDVKHKFKTDVVMIENADHLFSSYIWTKKLIDTSFSWVTEREREKHNER